jgi:hypothetical protein
MFNAGCLLIITLLIALGMHVVMATVVGERIEHTLPFVMSLPISIAQYTMAKIAANVSLFGAGWLILALGVSGVVLFRAGVPHGLFVLSTIMLLDILASYFVLLAVAVTTESMAWTIVTVIVGNIVLNLLTYTLGQDPSIKSDYTSMSIVWSPSAIGVVIGECAIIAAAIVATFAVQSRKTDFL